ncbi:hypothetical protein B0H13DRAFT_1866547 [Mycena leptocephala]|nr:hypothetical protein B0H13DRAFT_1866547 [Mycena leptocephala]
MALDDKPPIYACIIKHSVRVSALCRLCAALPYHRLSRPTPAVLLGITHIVSEKAASRSSCYFQARLHSRLQDVYLPQELDASRHLPHPYNAVTRDRARAVAFAADAVQLGVTVFIIAVCKEFLTQHQRIDDDARAPVAAPRRHRRVRHAFGPVSGMARLLPLRAHQASKLTSSPPPSSIPAACCPRRAHLTLPALRVLLSYYPSSVQPRISSALAAEKICTGDTQFNNI